MTNRKILFIDLPELTEEDLINYFEGFENVNQLSTIEDIFSYLRDNFDDTEAFSLNIHDGIFFILKDDTSVELTYSENECVLHSFSDKKYSEAGLYIYKINGGDLYICADCLTRLKPRIEISEEYDDSDGYYSNDYYLFPVNWTDNGVIEWYKKRSKKQSEYFYNQELRKQEDERLYDDCSNCIHMKQGECENGLEEYNKEYCEDHESR